MIDSPAISVPIRTDEHGSIRVGGTRVLLEVLIAAHEQGDTPEQIHEGFPTLQLADIYAVISYYLNNHELVDAYIYQQDEAGECIRRKIEAERPDVFALEAILREPSPNRTNECVSSPTKILTIAFCVEYRAITLILM